MVAPMNAEANALAAKSMTTSLPAGMSDMTLTGIAALAGRYVSPGFPSHPCSPSHGREQRPPPAASSSPPSPSASHIGHNMPTARGILPDVTAPKPSHSGPPSRHLSAASPSPVLPVVYKDRMDEADTNDRDATPVVNSGRDTVESNGPANVLQDEIVVGSSNSIRASPANIVSDREDTVIEDAGPPKRKRSTTTNSEAEDDRLFEQHSQNGQNSQNGQGPWTPAPRSRLPKAPQRPQQAGSTGTGNGTGTSSTHSGTPTPAGATTACKVDVPLGYWRDSTVPNVKDRHAIVGFIDTLERLRTRVVQFTRSGIPLSSEYMFPSGTGSSWVTFERIIFENHLIGLDHNQIKEYVRIRTEAAAFPETPEERALNEQAAVKEAMRRSSMHPYSDSPAPPQIAYGVDLPDFAMHPNAGRADKKRRVTNSLGGAPSSSENDPSSRASPGESMSVRSPSVVSAIQRSAIDLLPGTRPAKILVGYWRGSSEERIEDKHAVLGILGANDMFRVKVTRQTRDGRPVLGNFPVGAGALWINYDEVEFEQHIRHLSRPEMKEYVRVRQRQKDEGEDPAQQQVNEETAVYEAQSRVLKAGGAAQSTLGNSGRVDTISFATAARLDREAARVAELNEATRNHEQAEQRTGAANASTSGDDAPQRQTRRSTMDQQDDTASVVPAAAVNSNKAERVERTNSLARREIKRMEGLQQRNEQRAASSANANGTGNGTGSAAPGQPADAGNSNSNRQAFNENIGRLNKVWASQEASRLRADGEDAIIFAGVKYERKPTGPFEGKLVSPGAILSIDGEDYVEYRILTRPSFF